ncbi:degenerin del-1-like [Montipora capricornis]|uniref:degenerin del-1-like n=1 Tax=Montipora capricornis TaxID=246305 RepID=UPI0035F1F98E
MTSQDEEANSKKMAVDPKRSIKEVITQFCGYTTAHGLGRLAESQSVFRRVSWSLFCIGALTMFNVRFPAVTLCNLNMVRYDKLPKDFIRNIVADVLGESIESESEDSSSGQFSPIISTDVPTAGGVTVASYSGGTSSKTQDDTANDPNTDVVTNAFTTDGTPQDDSTAIPTGTENGIQTDSPTDIPMNSSVVAPTTSFASDVEGVDIDEDDDVDVDTVGDEDNDEGFDFDGLDGQQKAIEFEIEEAIRAELALQNDSTIFYMGHQFQDLVFECSYRGYDCRNYSRFWRHLWDYRHGNCYTFNGGINDDGKPQKVLESHITGPTGGLKLNLFVEQSQYVAEISHTAGARVIIHDQGQIPFPYNEGYSVLPSVSTSFAIRRTLIERADPFGNGSCVSESDLEHNSFYTKKFNASYSRQACLNTCHAEKQIAECGCAGSQFPNSDAEICNSRDQTTAKCLEKIQLMLLSRELDCEAHCPTPCREIQFGTTLSMGQWPSEGYENILERRVKNNSGLATEIKHGYYLSENFLQVNVYYDQLNYQKVTERISYEGVNLVADIGGQLGLWIGISVLTCCEFLELAWMIIRTVVERLSRTPIVHIKSPS